MRRFAATALILASLCTGPLLADRIDWSDGSTIEHSIERCAPPYRLGNGYAAYNVAWDGGPFPPHYAPKYQAPWEFEMPPSVQGTDAQHQTDGTNDHRVRENLRDQGNFVLSAQPQVSEDRLRLVQVVDKHAVAVLPQQPFNARDAHALVELGALMQWGHFCMVNADRPLLKEQAYNVCHQLASSLKGTGLADRFQTLATGSLPPGATSQSASYDQAMHDLVHYIYATYDRDGLWYYGVGTTVGGMYVLTSGSDQFHTPTYRELAHELLRFQPWLKPSHETLHALKELSEAPLTDAEDPPALCQRVLQAYWPLTAAK